MLRALLRPVLLSIALIFLFSCAPKRVEIPTYEGVDVREVLSARNTISAIDATFTIIFEKGDTEMRGEGVLNMSRNGDLNLRVYSLGFLGLEVISKAGVIRSNPRIDRNKCRILTQGLRDCLFWWDVQDYDVNEKDDGMYLLKNSSREVWLDKKTMLPIKQRVILDNGIEIYISYEDMTKMGNVWCPSTIKIELSQYSVKLRFKEISFTGDV
jgi:hypothetical protein